MRIYNFFQFLVFELCMYSCFQTFQSWTLYRNCNTLFRNSLWLNVLYLRYIVLYILELYFCLGCLQMLCLYHMCLIYTLILVYWCWQQPVFCWHLVVVLGGWWVHSTSGFGALRVLERGPRNQTSVDEGPPRNFCFFCQKKLSLLGLLAKIKV